MLPKRKPDGPRFYRKKTSVDQNVKAAEILHLNGIKIVGNFMIGLQK